MHDLPANSDPCILAPFNVAERLGLAQRPAWVPPSSMSLGPVDGYTAAVEMAVVARLWPGRGDAVDLAAARRRLVAGDGPLDRARRWLDSVPRLRGHVIAAARAQVSLLHNDLDRIARDPAGAGDTARGEALAWVHERDDLASVALLLGVDAEPVSRALVPLDRFARTHATMWRYLGPITSARLSEVAWQEPEAWWATLA